MNRTPQTRTARTARRAKTAAVVALALAGSALGAAAPAGATSRPGGTATLTMQAIAHSNHMLTVRGKMDAGSLTAAKQLTQKEFFLVVYGDDPHNDDFIDFGNNDRWTGYDKTGAYFEAIFPIKDDHLDEDYGKDEIYVAVSTPNDTNWILTNNVSGHF